MRKSWEQTTLLLFIPQGVVILASLVPQVPCRHYIVLSITYQDALEPDCKPQHRGFIFDPEPWNDDADLDMRSPNTYGYSMQSARPQLRHMKRKVSLLSSSFNLLDRCIPRCCLCS
ncbi:hypothetical protein F5Y10DRAFT_212635 [Nemania abortiva]|nr:hypothetical protein F5Y10DRAFT_212635 [Nemania abortiva]